MSQFASWRAYQDFAHTVRSTHRYIRTPEMEAFLEAVRATAKSRECTVPKGRPFWRAQRGHCSRDEDHDGTIVDRSEAYLPDRMKPRTGMGCEGRVNAKGIPCLYTATTRETAMSETRPWLDAFVSVGCFEILRDARIVDCSRFHDKNPAEIQAILETPFGSHPTPSAEKIEELVWTDIDRAFSEPVTENDSVPDYVPTQILAECFRAQGYDGIAYKSALTEDGFNLAFFDLGIAKLVVGQLYKTKSVKVTFGEHPEDEYFIGEEGQIVRQVITDIRANPPPSNK